jgi:Sugar (and other) transporter
MAYSPDALKGERQTLGMMLKKITPGLFLVCFVTAMLNMLFGFDTTSFSGVQSIPAFERQFGTPTSGGGYELSSSRASFMSSVAFAGKFFGTLVRTIPLSIYDLFWDAGTPRLSFPFCCKEDLRSMSNLTAAS